MIKPSLRFSVATVHACLIAAALAAAPGACLRAEESFRNEQSFVQVNLYEVGQEGYLSYRIPCLVITQKGTILAFTSARRAVSDWANIDLLLRRSTDGGRTWTPRLVIGSDPKRKDVVDNPVAIANRRTGAVHFLYQTNYASIFHKFSTDEGATWSEPVEITPMLGAFREKYKYNWNVIAPGPGHAIQLDNGRLLVPVWLCNSGTKAHRPSVVATIYSDDNGATWHCGEILPATQKNMNESALVQLDDGRVAMYIRNETAGAYCHAVAVSPDGATGWSDAALHKQLYTPICFATVLRLSSAKDGGKSRLLYVHPDNPDDTEVIRAAWGARRRGNVTVRLSYDEGKTWDVSRVLEPGRSSYADLAVAPDGTIYCLYERGSIKGNELNTRFLSIARFNLEWLTCGEDKLQ